MAKKRNENTPQRILDAALALWSEKGYETTTMRELARRLGMGTSSLYFHFDSKEAIVQHLYQSLNARALAAFRANDDGDIDLGHNFARFLAQKTAVMAPHSGCLAAILREAIAPPSGLSPFSPDSSPTLEASVHFLAELVERAGIAGGAKAERIGRLLWTVHVAVLLYWTHDRTADKVNSARLIGKLADAGKLLPLLSSVPELDEYLAIVDGLFAPAPAAAVASVASEEAPTRACDVVVVGAGPIGILYSLFLRQRRPETRILVLDKAAAAGHRIGESTLSGFCKALRTVGIPHEAMQRLFYPKNGLGFFHADETTQSLQAAPEYILETFDETFQVERRVLDTMLVEHARRQGIEVLRGAKVDVANSTFGAAGNLVHYHIGAGHFRVQCSLVVDASGPAGLLSRHFDLRTSDGLPFQTGSVWTYYEDVRPLGRYGNWRASAQYPRDEYTQHICFREGWLWYIPLVSWQQAPGANLQSLLNRLSQGGNPSPDRSALEAAYGCPTRPIASIGLTLRSDRDRRLRADPQGAFEYYKRRYPVIEHLLRGATSLGDYYGTGQSYMSRQSMRSHCRRVVGDGWMLVGDAAFFVDPLISPGLTGGAAQAFFAAKETARALTAGVYASDFFAAYQSYVHRLHEALERDNQLVYMSFNHPQALSLIQRFQEIDARRHFNDHVGDYGDEDTNVWGILDGAYQGLQHSAWQVMREEEEAVTGEVDIGEQTARDYERMMSRLRSLLDPYVDANRELTPYVRDNIGS